MPDERSELDQIIDHVREYVETRIELAKLNVIEKSSLLAGSLVSGLLIGITFIIVIIFLSFSLAFYLGDYFGQLYAGFLMVGIIYLLSGLLMLIFKDQWIKNPLVNSMVRSFFKENEEKNGKRK